MTITRTDLKIFKPERLGNETDAGGQRTANPVTSGLLNDLFTPISDIDHAQAAINFVKCYPSLNTAGTERLIGAHTFINQPPVDPMVNIMIVESDKITDKSTTKDIIEIVEGTIIPGVLLSNKMSGMVAGQDRLQGFASSKYGNQTYGFEKSPVKAGEIYVLSVEYTGAESADWPRFNHFIRIVKLDPLSGMVLFDPPIPQKAPDQFVIINGQSGCLVLRDVNRGSTVTYHGTTKTTGIAATGSTLLPVENTNGRIIPRVVSQSVQLNNEPFAQSEVGLTYSLKTIPAASTDYSVEIADIIAPAGEQIIARVEYLAASSVTGDPVLTTNNISPAKLVGTTLSFTLNRVPTSTTLTIKYYSSSIYSNYAYTYITPPTLPAGKALLLRTIKGTVEFLATGARYSVLPNPSSPNNLESPIYDLASDTYTNKLVAILNPITGEPTYYNGFTNINYDAVLLNSASPEDLATEVRFIIPFLEYKLDTFYLTAQENDGTPVSCSADQYGDVTGAGVAGSIVNGLVIITFATAVVRSTVRYNITEIAQLSPPTSLYGINALRVPAGGVVNIFDKWSTFAIQHSQYQNVVSPSTGQVKTIRSDSRFVDITDANSVSLWTITNDNFTVDLVAGTVTINSDFAGFTAPFTLTDTIGELGLVANLTDNSISALSPLSREYPSGSNVSSVYKMGDLSARVVNVRDMVSWANNWDVDTTAATGNLNVAAHPIVVVNNSCINEDWAIIFTSATAYRCVGRGVGQVATGDTLNNFAPINAALGLPYFMIPKEAFGAGWNAGETIRFATKAASKPTAFVRVVNPGHSNILTDRTLISFRGNEA